MNLIERSHWEAVAAQPADLRRFRPSFDRLLRRHLPRRPGLSLLEVGCAPGGNLVYFERQFGYQPHGLDYVANLEVVEGNLRAAGLERFTLYHQALEEFQPGRSFDVVVSMGFLEHFTSWREVLGRIVDLAAPGGYVVTTVPNFCGLQHRLRRLLTPAALEGHGRELMDPRLLAAEHRARGLEVLFAGPYLTFGFWGEEAVHGWRRTAVRALSRIGWLVRRHELNVLPSRWLSPHVAVIARKREESSWPARAKR